MKFENPIMNISMFEVENVVTQASGQDVPPVEPASAAEAVTAFINDNNPGGGVTITF